VQSRGSTRLPAVDLVLLRAATSLCRYCPHREQFNQATLAAAYEKRTEKIKPDRAEYDAAKVRVCGGDGWHAGSVGVGDGRFGGCLASTCTLLFLLSHFSQMLPQPGLAHAQLPTHPSLQAADPEFYRTADSLLYGAAGRVSEAGIDRMVDELNERWVGKGEGDGGGGGGPARASASLLPYATVLSNSHSPSLPLNASAPSHSSTSAALPTLPLQPGQEQGIQPAAQVPRGPRCRLHQ
jgi:hypothetical protein